MNLRRLSQVAHHLDERVRRCQYNSLVLFILEKPYADLLAQANTDAEAITAEPSDELDAKHIGSKPLSTSFTTNALIQFFTSVIRAYEDLLSIANHPRSPLKDKKFIKKLGKDMREHRKTLMKLLRVALNDAPDLLSELAARPSAIPESALPQAGSFDPDDSERQDELLSAPVSLAELESKLDRRNFLVEKKEVASVALSQSSSSSTAVASSSSSSAPPDSQPAPTLLGLCRKIQSASNTPEMLKKELLDVFGKPSNQPLLSEALAGEGVDVTDQGHTLLTYAIALNLDRSKKAARYVLEYCLPPTKDAKEQVINRIIEAKNENNRYAGCNALAVAVIMKNTRLAQLLLSLGAKPVYSEARRAEYMDGYTAVMLDVKGISSVQRSYLLPSAHVAENKRRKAEAPLVELVSSKNNKAKAKRQKLETPPPQSSVAAAGPRVKNGI